MTGNRDFRECPGLSPLEKAIRFHREGKLDEAEALYLYAICKGISQEIAYSNLGVLHKSKGDLNQAINAYQNALRYNPQFADAHANLGSIYALTGNLEQALASSAAAIRLNPTHINAHINLGTIYKSLGQLTLATEALRNALELDPTNPDAHWELSLLELLTGDYGAGWARYESRLFTKGIDRNPHALPKCERATSLHENRGEHLLVVSEQGLGDTLQFVRYISTVQNLGYSTSLCIPPKLHSLARASGMECPLVSAHEATQVAHGNWLPMLSIPRHLNVSPSNPIEIENYIAPPKHLKEKWLGLLAKDTRPIIGVNWRANRHDGAKANRDFPLEYLARIARDLNFRIISLQRNARDEPSMSGLSHLSEEAQQNRIHELADSDNPNCFAEYAAVITNCDLVITTATTTCHLAAAMGVKTWTLLPKIPDWRWGLEGTTSFWYPTMRLFRQLDDGKWDDVLLHIADALKLEWTEQR